MGRHKSLLTEEILCRIESDLKQIPNSHVILKLLALKAATSYKQSDVAQIYNISRSTLQRWAYLYKNYGIEALKPKPKGHNPSKLTNSEKAIIRKWIIDSIDSSDNQVHWTLKRLKHEVYKVFEKSVSKTPLWLTLRSMGLSLRKPRPRHYKSDLKKQEDFKKNSTND